MATKQENKLDSDRVRRALEEVPLWTLESGRLHRTFKFADFVTAFGWMSACALVAEKMDHHPDWSNSWNKVTVDLMTHTANGLTENDFALAHTMDDLAKKLGGE